MSKVRKIGLCRGDGMAYLKFSVPVANPAAVIGAIGWGDGRPFPVKVYPAPEGHDGRRSFWVAAFPLFDKGVRPVGRFELQFFEEHADPARRGGADVEPLGALSFTGLATKIESRLNYKLRPALCAQIRDYDRDNSRDEAYHLRIVHRFAGAPKVTRADVVPVDAHMSAGLTTQGTLEPQVVWRLEASWAGSPDAKPHVGVYDYNACPIPHDLWPFEFQPAVPNAAMGSPESLNRLFVSIGLPERAKEFYFLASHPESVFAVSDDGPTADPERHAHPTVGLPLPATIAMDPYKDKDQEYRTWLHQRDARADDKAYRVQLTRQQATPDQLARQRVASMTPPHEGGLFAWQPLISVVVPCFRSDPAFLDALLESVLAQSYPSWELVLVDSSSQESPVVAQAVAAHPDARIRRIELAENLGIVGNTNAGIAQAQGDYVAFLDHDDLLEPDALFCYAQAINGLPCQPWNGQVPAGAKPNVASSADEASVGEATCSEALGGESLDALALYRWEDRWQSAPERPLRDAPSAAASNGPADMTVKPLDASAPFASATHVDLAAAVRSQAPDVLYCDEDLFDTPGVWRQPMFKTQLNLDLLYSHNCITHFLMASRRLLDEIGTSTQDVAGAQDYDLCLRAYAAGARFAHVPRVLYHWREHAGSTSGDNAESKPYAHEAGRLALERHFASRGLAVSVEDAAQPFVYRVRHQLPDPAPRISIIIPSKDQHGMLRACIDSILQRATYPDFEIVVVENNSTEPETFAYYEQVQAHCANVRVVTWTPDDPATEPFNYSKIVNFGARQATGELLLFLNNDTAVIEPSFLEEMAGYLQRPEVGVVGAKLYFRDMLTQHAGIQVGVYDAVAHVNQDFPPERQGYLAYAVRPGNFSAVTGACQMTRRDVFEELGGYCEELAVGFNDADFCLMARARGYRSVFTPYAQLHHYEFVTRGREVADPAKQARWEREFALFNSRWPWVSEQGDPYHNPNLKRDNIYYALREAGDR